MNMYMMSFKKLPEIKLGPNILTIFMHAPECGAKQIIPTNTIPPMAIPKVFAGI